ncbi:rhomboid family intramembrane serine protease [Thermosipho atlanticus]|uniref:Membrane associated serine protease, rhomboid family n=1 Tax=Thermosipho atlanticus DSM 15807 TaxID=1123380 RepID=A0A1M5T4A0_9BACT|nr:rhomboid family intramembrane serine protease [Thermosipho atlanticus]SHH45565.1 Membrane associated serine protease, rhomboid family [Thermosipho atlanticus DSM 15807]
MFPLYDTIPSRKRPYITHIIILANVIVFFYEIILNEPQLQAFFFNYGIVPLRYTWRFTSKLKYQIIWKEIQPFIVSNPIVPFISHMFVHGGWSHILGNMWFLWIFGDNVEDRMGHFNYLLFYLSGGLFALTFHWLFNFYSPYPLIGASGAISAVMGAYFIQFWYSKIVTLVIWFIPFLVEIPAVVYLFFWFMFQILNGTLADITGSGVAYWAHVGGFIYGMIVGGRIRRYYL